MCILWRIRIPYQFDPTSAFLALLSGVTNMRCATKLLGFLCLSLPPSFTLLVGVDLESAGNLKVGLTFAGTIISEHNSQIRGCGVSLSVFLSYMLASKAGKSEALYFPACSSIGCSARGMLDMPLKVIPLDSELASSPATSVMQRNGLLVVWNPGLSLDMR
jgi:hypothetical protein